MIVGCFLAFTNDAQSRSKRMAKAYGDWGG